MDTFVSAYPKALYLNANKARKLVEDIAKGKMRLTVVQAISLYRQKNESEIEKILLNLVSQYRAYSHPVAWHNRSEILDLYTAYLTHSRSNQNSDQVAQALGLSINETNVLKEKVCVP